MKQSAKRFASRIISAESFAQLKKGIKEGLPEWQATMARYDDPEIEDMEEVWGF